MEVYIWGEKNLKICAIITICFTCGFYFNGCGTFLLLQIDNYHTIHFMQKSQVQ